MMVSQWVVNAGNHQPLLKAKHCWIDRETQQLPPAQALRWQQGTMDPLSKSQGTVNNESSKDVPGKQKYHHGLHRTTSRNHSWGDWDSDKQDGFRNGGLSKRKKKKKRKRKLNKTWNTPQNDVKNRKTSEDCLMPLSAWLWFQLSLLFSLLASKS